MLWRDLFPVHPFTPTPTIDTTDRVPRHVTRGSGRTTETLWTACARLPKCSGGGATNNPAMQGTRRVNGGFCRWEKEIVALGPTSAEDHVINPYPNVYVGLQVSK